jgi:S1-C subfamily serine protease
MGIALTEGDVAAKNHLCHLSIATKRSIAGHRMAILICFLSLNLNHWPQPMAVAWGLTIHQPHRRKRRSVQPWLVPVLSSSKERSKIGPRSYIYASSSSNTDDTDGEVESSSNITEVPQLEENENSEILEGTNISFLGGGGKTPNNVNDDTRENRFNVFRRKGERKEISALKPKVSETLREDLKKLSKRDEDGLTPQEAPKTLSIDSHSSLSPTENLKIISKQEQSNRSKNKSHGSKRTPSVESREQVSRRQPKKRGMMQFAKRLVQLFSMAAAIFVVTPFVSGELASFQQPLLFERGWSSPSSDETLARHSPGDTTSSVTVVEESGAADIAGNRERGETGMVPKQDEGKFSTKGSSGDYRLPLERRSLVLSFVTDAVQKIGPSVVRIDTETHMVEDEAEGLPTSPRNPGFVQQGQGSGLIFSRDGLILTNAHVIEGATKVTITMADGRIYEAEVKGADEIVDIAVLKIIPPDDEKTSVLQLPAATLGDSDSLMVGRIVVAVGSAGGLDGSVTMGIVSGLERSSTVVGIPHKKVDYIQTDAAINPGNSGGPLVDVETGDVIGINAAIRAHMEGTSFSIPINRVRDIMYDLAEGVEIKHGYLGVSLATCTPEWAKRNNAKADSEALKIPEVKGAIVHKVFPRTPAEKGGLRASDIILEINGERVGTSDSARRLIDQAPVDKVSKTFVDAKHLLHLTPPRHTFRSIESRSHGFEK